MSRGLGKIQRKLVALMKDHPRGRWSTPELCDLIYGEIKVTESDPWRQRWERERQLASRTVAITRAISSMILPPGWRYEWPYRGRLHYLSFHPGDL